MVSTTYNLRGGGEWWRGSKSSFCKGKKIGKKRLERRFGTRMLAIFLSGLLAQVFSKRFRFYIKIKTMLKNPINQTVTLIKQSEV